MKRILKLVLLAAFMHSASSSAENPPVAKPKPKAKPDYQYLSKGIEVPAATAEEPKVKAFGPDTILAAKQYLDDGAHHWVREKSCVACHSTGVYMVERPVLTPQLGKPSEEVHASFVEGVRATVGKPTLLNGVKVFRRSTPPRLVNGREASPLFGAKLTPTSKPKNCGER